MRNFQAAARARGTRSGSHDRATARDPTDSRLRYSRAGSRPDACARRGDALRRCSRTAGERTAGDVRRPQALPDRQADGRRDSDRWRVQLRCALRRSIERGWQGECSSSNSAMKPRRQALFGTGEEV